MRRLPAIYGAPPPPGAPRGDVRIGAIKIEGGRLTDASRVVTSMRAGFRSCYMRALAEYGDTAGTLQLAIEVGPHGEVVRAVAKPGAKLNPSLVSCVEGRARASQFDAPEGKAKTQIGVDVTFTRQPTDSPQDPP